MPATDLVRDHAARIEAALQAIDLPAEPVSLYEPVRYVLAGGGKRVRPVFVLLAAEAVGGPADAALPAALAVEIFHNFTLVHDDIMDRAATRRGRPTVHTRWDEPTAILVGDVMYGLAYDQLLDLDDALLPAVMRPFQWMVARLCEGQQRDMDFATRNDVTVADYLEMIAGKTGALIECAFLLGGLAGGASAEQAQALREAGREAGRAFQIQDDLLDLVADDPGWGKPIGGDFIEGKKAYLLLQALAQADGEDSQFFQRVVAYGGVEAAAVSDVRTRLDRMGVLAATRDTVHAHYDAAIARLSMLPELPAREALVDFLRQMRARTR